MYYPEGMKARVSPVQSIEPHRILAPTRDSNQEPSSSQSIVVTMDYTTASLLFRCRDLDMQGFKRRLDRRAITYVGAGIHLGGTESARTAVGRVLVDSRT